MNRNLTALQTEIAPKWVAEPKVRGTWSLLYSCVFTLILCVWTALHLNVPAQGEGAFQIWRRKLKWVAIALFAPEIVLYTAWYQLHTARMLYKELNWYAKSAKASNHPQECLITVRTYQHHDWSDRMADVDSETLKRDHFLKRCWSWLLKRCWSRSSRNNDNASDSLRFGMDYCYYAVMGGFTVDLSCMHDRIKVVTLSPASLLALASRGYFFDIASETISDKSKADLLAKGLVLCQVSWLVIQSIARARAQLPLTILEVHTMVHVVCAFLMYCFWLQKPKDISDPTRVDSNGCQSVLAELLMRNLGLLGLQDEWQRIEFWDSTDRHAPYLESKYLNLKRHLTLDNCVRDTEISGDLSNDFRHFESVEGVEYATTLMTGQFLPCGLGPGNINGHRILVHLTEKDVVRWNEAAQSILNSGNFETKNGQEDLSIHIPSQVLSYFKPRQFNFEFDFDFRLDEQWNLKKQIAFTAILCTLAGIYGAVHFAARNFFFSTDHERILWIISCYIMLSGAMFPLVGVIVFGGIKRTIGGFHEVLMNFLLVLMVVYLLGSLLGILLGVLYVAARIYIVFEAFLSLRHVPIGVYTIPAWTNYFPHL